MRLFHSLRLPVMLLLSAVLTACGPARTSTPAPTYALLLPRTSTPTPANAALPTETSLPTQTAEPVFVSTLAVLVTPVVLPASTATPVPTPDAVLSQVKLIGLDWYKNYDMLLSFQFPGPVDPKLYHVTLADKEFTCEVLAQFPDRLYCRGQGAKVLAVATARIYLAGSPVVGFEKDVWVPYFNK